MEQERLIDSQAQSGEHEVDKSPPVAGPSSSGGAGPSEAEAGQQFRPPSPDVDDEYKMNGNLYANRKTISLASFSIGLITSNICTIKNLAMAPTHHFFFVIMLCLGFSILLQVIKRVFILNWEAYNISDFRSFADCFWSVNTGPTSTNFAMEQEGCTESTRTTSWYPLSRIWSPASTSLPWVSSLPSHHLTNSF